MTRAAFGDSDPIAGRGEQSEVVGAAWRVVEYVGPDGVPLHVVGAPSREPGVGRANTADTYEWFATELAELHRGRRIVIVTSDIYMRYQHADAMRMLALPYGVEIDAVGIQPGDVGTRLKQVFRASQLPAGDPLHDPRVARSVRGRLGPMPLS